jgi:asparagine synthase (glutamine-hydrolysing)
MSAIFGIYNLSGKPVPLMVLEEMSAILSHRGADDTGIWTDDLVGFGHRMLQTTPESLNEKLPKSFRNGDFAITADARIDNRNELLNELGLSSQPKYLISIQNRRTARIRQNEFAKNKMIEI